VPKENVVEYVEKRSRKRSADMVAVEVGAVLKTVPKMKWSRRNFGRVNWISR
jgi:hypothetical protein